MCDGMDSDTDAIVSPELLAILRCPATGQPLTIAPKEVIARVARENEVTAGLLREDGKVIYPIRDGIPRLLIEDAVAIP